jgi:hypothetical protein
LKERQGRFYCCQGPLPASNAGHAPERGVSPSRYARTPGEDATSTAPSSATVSVVGRTRELAAVERFLAESAADAGTLVVDGPPGIGKTALWDRALQLASEQGWSLLSTRSAQPEVRLTYVALSDLLSGVPRTALGHLAEPERRALDVALLRAEPGGGGLAQRAVAQGFLAVLKSLAEDSRVLVAVDDVDWLDAARPTLGRSRGRRPAGGSVVAAFARAPDRGCVASSRTRPTRRRAPRRLEAQGGPGIPSRVAGCSLAHGRGGGAVWWRRIILS